jgi:hypothetical protein
MDEGRKRVIGIIAGILVSRHFKTPEDLFGTAQNNSPRSDAMIAASVQWAEKIMDKIDLRCGEKTTARAGSRPEPLA